jgi:hypothetical protein
MHPRYLAGAGLRFPAYDLTKTSALTGAPFAMISLQRIATCALATAIAAETKDQRVLQPIKGRQTERLR